MKSLRLIIGILSLVLCLVVVFQSCATGVVNGIEQNTSDTSAGGGIILAKASDELAVKVGCQHSSR